MPLDFKQSILHFMMFHFIDGYFSTAVGLELGDV